MQIVKANWADEGIKNGCTKPYYVMCDDDIYVVKFMQNPEGLRVLANEYIGAKIAEILHLPLASPSIVEVDDDFVTHYGKQISLHVGEEISAGIHFGTKKVKKIYPITNSAMLQAARNIDIIPEVVLFDHWICNTDRESNGGNLLFDASKMEVVVIDHTHAFDLGPIWTATDLRQRIGEGFRPFNMSGFVYKKLVLHIKGNNPFHRILDKMSRVTDDHLWDIISTVPLEWGVTEEEKAVLHSYLCDRLSRIEQVLPLLKPVLPFWKGGS